MITINNLEVKYGEEIALQVKTPITFEEGDRIGIIGSNGAGKSTLVKAILGLINYKGNIRTKLKPTEISAHLQENNYPSTMAVKYVVEGILGMKIKNNHELNDLISFFDFENCLNKKFSELSGGQKQRLTIILVLMQNNQLVFFDEVTSGLDFETRQNLMNKIIQWYDDKKSTICIVSHYYEELDQLANKILILDKGKVVDFGYKKALFEKYCGKSIITIENNIQNKKLAENFKRILSPEHLIAIPCYTKEMELEIAKILINKNVNFKRSDNDIEIMSINAKANYDGGNNNEREVV